MLTIATKMPNVVESKMPQGNVPHRLSAHKPTIKQTRDEVIKTVLICSIKATEPKASLIHEHLTCEHGRNYTTKEMN